jgi:hypothetical protein
VYAWECLSHVYLSLKKKGLSHFWGERFKQNGGVLILLKVEIKVTENLVFINTFVVSLFTEHNCQSL